MVRIVLTIYDAVAWQTIPKNQPILMYVDGKYVTYPAALALRPSRFWTVTTTGNSIADIVDVEGGNASPARAAFGARLGYWHTVYCSLSTYPQVVTEMAKVGSPTWSWFAADPTGEPHLPPGASACQYAWHALGQCPANYDMSIALDSWATKAIGPQLGQEIPQMQTTNLGNGRLVTPAVGAGPNTGHFFLIFTNEDGSKPSFVDVTDGAGAQGPGGTLYTVSG